MYIKLNSNEPQISQVNKDIVEYILNKQDQKFGKESPHTTNRGKVLEYLGIAFDFRQCGKLKFVMCDYIK
jgi:hypothetical protein